jgi:hypothetical protein
MRCQISTSDMPGCGKCVCFASPMHDAVKWQQVVHQECFISTSEHIQLSGVARNTCFFRWNGLSDLGISADLVEELHCLASSDMHASTTLHHAGRSSTANQKPQSHYIHRRCTATAPAGLRIHLISMPE